MGGRSLLTHHPRMMCARVLRTSLSKQGQKVMRKNKYRQGGAGLKCVEKTHLLNGLPDLYFRQLESEGESNVWMLLKYRNIQPKFKGTENKAQ